MLIDFIAENKSKLDINMLDELSKRFSGDEIVDALDSVIKMEYLTLDSLRRNNVLDMNSDELKLLADSFSVHANLIDNLFKVRNEFVEKYL